MNLTQLCRALDRKSGVAMDVSAQTEWLNEAVQAISEERDWPWLDGYATFSTVAGTAAYDLPTDWKRTRAVTYDGAPANRISIVDGDAYDYGFDDWRGQVSYSIESSDLIFYPTPQSVVTVKHRYVKQEPLLDNGTDTPLMPSHFHQAIVAYACARVMDRIDPQRADSFDAEYERWKVRMLDAAARSQQPARVRVRAGGGF